MKTVEKKREKKERCAGKSNLLCMAKGLAVAFAITCIIFIGFGILLTYTEISEESLPMVSLVCTALSAGVAGFDWQPVCRKEGSCGEWRQEGLM